MKIDYGYLRLVVYKPGTRRPHGERLKQVLRLHDIFGLNVHDLKDCPQDVRLKEIYRRSHDTSKGDNVISIGPWLQSIRKARDANLNDRNQIVSRLKRDRPDNAFDSYDAFKPK